MLQQAATGQPARGAAEPRVGSLRLVVIHGDPPGHVLTATDGATIGRDEAATLPLPHTSISRHHAVLRQDGAGEAWTIEDVASTNGTYVNGVRVTTRCPVHHGDLISLGAVVLKAFVSEQRPREEAERTPPHVDPLTGAFTRTYLKERLEAEVTESYRRRQPISIACIDVDGFADVRERLGAAAADALLREIADLLRDRLRRSDVLARDDGAAFVAVLSEVSLPIAVRIGRRLMKALRGTPLRAAGVPQPLTASVGVASTDGRWLSAAELVEGGRQALERAHRRGGNRVCA